MRNSIGVAATMLVLASGSSALFAGTALAAPSTSIGPGGISKAADNCVSYTIKNGKLVKSTTSGCTSSNTSTNGSGGSSGGGSQGTSSQGTVTNNCVPASSCSGSAKGTGGNSH